MKTHRCNITPLYFATDEKSMKPEELRIHPRYKATLPVELQTVDSGITDDNLPALRFQSVTRDISLGGVLVDLSQEAKNLDPNFQPGWIRERFFWIHIKDVYTIPEGFFAKARAVRFVEEDQTHPEAVGLEFQDLVQQTIIHLKKFLDDLKSKQK